MEEEGGGWDLPHHHHPTHDQHTDKAEEEMGVLHGLVRLTNDDIFGEALRFLDHAQAEEGGPADEATTTTGTLLPNNDQQAMMVVVVPVQQQA